MRTFFSALLLTTICFTGADAQMYPMNGGDCNGDGAIDITDATCILNYLFGGGAPPATIAAEMNPTPQDFLSIDPAERFVDNGDDTVIDLATGLQWYTGGVLRSFHPGQLNPTQSGYDYIDQTLADFNAQDVYGDWRLVTVYEFSAAFPYETLGKWSNFSALSRPPGFFNCGGWLQPFASNADMAQSPNPIMKAFYGAGQGVGSPNALRVRFPGVVEIDSSEQNYAGRIYTYSSFPRLDIGFESNSCGLSGSDWILPHPFPSRIDNQTNYQHFLIVRKAA